MKCIKRAVITKGGKDDTIRPVQQIEYLEKTTDAEIIFPYGVHANLPEDSILTVFDILGNSSNKVAIGGLPNERIQVEVGEVVFFHPLTKAKIHFKKNGEIEIDALEKHIKINCKTASITATDELVIDSPSTKWNGDIELTGDINQSGQIVNDDIISGGISLTGHTHIGSPTAATGAVSNTGAAV